MLCTTNITQMIKNCIWNNYFLLNVHRFHRQQDKCIVLDTHSLILRSLNYAVYRRCATLLLHLSQPVVMWMIFATHLLQVEWDLEVDIYKIILACSKVHKFKSLGKNSANLEKNRLFFPIITLHSLKFCHF